MQNAECRMQNWYGKHGEETFGRSINDNLCYKKAPLE